MTKRHLTFDDNEEIAQELDELSASIGISRATMLRKGAQLALQYYREYIIRMEKLEKDRETK